MPRRDPCRSCLLALALSAGAAGMASAQAPVSVPPAATGSGSGTVPLQQIDQTSADRHSLSQSLRVMPVDLSPHNFERVYQVPGRDDLMMRTNGALYAVFEQSSYARDPQRKGQLKAVVPAATVFYIGRPDFSVIRSAGVRDLSFVPNDPAPAPAGKPLTSMPGASRLPSEPVDGRASSTRVDARTDARVSGGPGEGADPAAIHADDDEPRHADRSVPSRPPADVAPDGRAADDAPAPAPVRQEQPGFRERIDELMRRAARPSSQK